MKKIFLSILSILFFLSPLYSQDVEDLYGIWEGKDRFVFIEPVNTPSEKGAVVGEHVALEDTKIEIVILLKDYYGWYYDRVVEPTKYSKSYPRTRNSATTRNAEHVYLEVNQIDKSTFDNTYELVLSYSKKQRNYIPIVIIDDNMFLNFAVQDKNDRNFYRGVATSKGISVSEMAVNDNLISYYIKDNSIYNLRYWITDMDYEDSMVSYSKNNFDFSVPKHIISGGNNYACVPGRRKVIRNPNDGQKFNNEQYLLVEDESILLLDSEPYLTRLLDKNSFEELMTIMEEANARRKPDPDPLFPDVNLDFHWDLIDVLEKDNKIIQEVRKRQEAFGPRGKDQNN